MLALNKKTNIKDIMNYMMTIERESDYIDYYEKVITWALENWNIPNLECNRQNAIMILDKNLKYWAKR